MAQKKAAAPEKKAKAKTAAKKKSQVKSKPAARKKAAPAASATRQVTFALKAKSAEWVSVVGEFNAWHEDKGAMKHGEDGVWTKTLRLKPGSYQYKFIVDGEWWADPDNPTFCYNEHGTTNSIVDVPE